MRHDPKKFLEYLRKTLGKDLEKAAKFQAQIKKEREKVRQIKLQTQELKYKLAQSSSQPVQGDN